MRDRKRIPGADGGDYRLRSWGEKFNFLISTIRQRWEIKQDPCLSD
jgi:hypothetical protein